MKTFQITRRIEIDAGHRVATHGSQCRHIHGHRYRIEACMEAEKLVDSGVESGMVMDFGFLKECMMRIIHNRCDHNFIVWEKDLVVLKRCIKDYDEYKQQSVAQELHRFGYYVHDGEPTDDAFRLYIMPDIPTAENLAKHWFELLSKEVVQCVDHTDIRLKRVTVWETPNCEATYPC